MVPLFKNIDRKELESYSKDGAPDNNQKITSGFLDFFLFTATSVDGASQSFPFAHRRALCKNTTYHCSGTIPICVHDCVVFKKRERKQVFIQMIMH
jgi:hypothetical protein